MSSTLQIEFAQAMSDFKNMFPEMDDDVIEAVLRSNQGAVDATIDQLLAMSTDNQNEKIRNELHSPVKVPIALNKTKSQTALEGNNTAIEATPKRDHVTSVGADLSGLRVNAGASPKVKKNLSISYSPTNEAKKTNSCDIKLDRNWKPPLLGPLPPTFLRIAFKQIPGKKNETELPDEQFAMMLQNEEFMNELRWNQDFMLSLERETDKERGEDDAVFKERLRCMSKKSRKKFMQLARVFTWQRHKKSAQVPKHSHPPDSLLLHEEYDEDDNDQHKLQQQNLSTSQQKSANQLEKKN